MCARRPTQGEEEPVIDFFYGTHVGLQHVGARLAVGAVIQKGKYPDHRYRADNKDNQHRPTEARSPGVERRHNRATIFSRMKRSLKSVLGSTCVRTIGSIGGGTPREQRTNDIATDPGEG